jgi:hypothetical protein
MPTHMMYSDMYNMMSKTLNFGDINSLSSMQAENFEMYTIEEFDPFAPINFDQFNCI